MICKLLKCAYSEDWNANSLVLEEAFYVDEDREEERSTSRTRTRMCFTLSRSHSSFLPHRIRGDRAQLTNIRMRKCDSIMIAMRMNGFNGHKGMDTRFLNLYFVTIIYYIWAYGYQELYHGRERIQAFLHGVSRGGQMSLGIYVFSNLGYSYMKVRSPRGRIKQAINISLKFFRLNK